MYLILVNFPQNNSYPQNRHMAKLVMIERRREQLLELRDSQLAPRTCEKFLVFDEQLVFLTYEIWKQILTRMENCFSPEEETDTPRNPMVLLPTFLVFVDLCIARASRVVILQLALIREEWVGQKDQTCSLQERPAQVKLARASR